MGALYRPLLVGVLLIVPLAACTHRNVLGPGARVVAGTDFTCVELPGGTVRCCGQGWEAELGNGAFEDEGHLVDVKGLEDVTSLSAGGFHACAVRKDGSVWCWGENRFDQLGFSMPEGKSAVARPTETLGGRATQVSSGILHACARLTDGTVRCWGANAQGELGTGTKSTEPSRPVRVVGLDHVAQVAVGSFATCARLDDGSVRCWGANDRGQLGNGTTEISLTPTPVVGITGALEIGLGNDLGCARLGSGEVVCWGGGGRTPPSLVPGVAHAVQIVVHGDFGCARLENGTIECWSSARAPTKALVHSPSLVFTDVARGGGHTCGIDSKGELVCEGTGQHGQLCDGSSPPRSSTFPPP